MDVLDVESGRRYPMQRIHEQGLFEAVFMRRSELFPYRLITIDPDGGEHDIEDPYRFPPQLTAYDLHLFGEGNLIYSYEKLGAHFRIIDGVKGVSFAVWAPNAERVSVVGEFNGWDTRYPCHALS